MQSRLLRLAVVCAVCLTLASCGDSDNGPSSPGDVTPPSVSQVSLADNETDVGLVERISVTFSEPMDASTIGDTTLFVVGRSSAGHVEYDEATRTACFTPDTLYAAEAPYAFVVSDDITDASGNALAAPDTTSFETGPLDCDHLTDYLEPNDEIGGAAAAELDRPYPTLTVCGDDDDYYVFTVEEPATVTANTFIKYAPESESWGIFFLRTDGDAYATLGTSATTGELRSFHFSFLPGTYALRVFGGGDAVYVLYDMELVTSEPCPDDDYEDNDFRDEAQPIATGLTTDLGGCYLDADYYTFDVEAGQFVTVTATQHPHGGWGHSRMRIYDPSGASYGFDSNETETTLEWTVEQSGTCTIMVQFWTDLWYDLEIALDD